MLALLIVSIILGIVIVGLTRIDFLFWVVAVIIFICGLPVALISRFIREEAKFAQNQEDHREEMRQRSEEKQELHRRIWEEGRLEKYLNRGERKRRHMGFNVDIDSKPHPRDEKGRLIAEKL